MRHLPALAALAGCAAETYDSGVGEPVVATDAQAEFHRGDLPVDDTRTDPHVVYAAGVGSVITVGQGDLTFQGLASTDAYAVGVQLPGVGSGWWGVPVDGPDVTQEGQLLFDVTLDFRREVPYGLQELTFVALDGRGEGGPAYATTLCLLPETAAGSFWACDEATTPPNAIVSLSWDTAVDLDLVVVTPDGKVVSGKAPTTAIATAEIPSEVLADPSTGTVTRDSNSNCVIDGINLESLVFPGEPPPGTYRVYARLHHGCGAPVVHYQADLLRRVDAEDGTHPVETTPLGGGILLASQASRDPGALGTLVVTLKL